MVLFPPPFYFFFISQTSYRTFKIISSYELARPIMGTIFLVNIYSVTKILRKIRATTFTERLRKITREGPGAPGMSNAASN